MKTTAKDFKAFQRYCRKWQKELGLMNYSLGFRHNNDHPDSESWVAETEDGNAVAGLTSNWDEAITTHSIERAAFHEMHELLMWEIRCLLRQVLSEEVVNKKIHAVIRPLENLLFPVS